jgi:hypothetical protein
MSSCLRREETRPTFKANTGHETVERSITYDKA